MGAAFSRFVSVLINRIPRQIQWGVRRSSRLGCSTRRPDADYSVILIIGGFLVGIALWLVPKLQTLEWGILFILLAALGWVDIKTKTLPNRLTMTLALVGLIVSGIEGSLLSSLQAGFLGGGLFAGIRITAKWWFKREAMGMGDIKLAAGLGIWLGIPGFLLMSYLSFLIGGLVAIVMVLIKGTSLKETLPFGPSMIMATTLTIWFQDAIIQWYQAFILT